MKAIYYARIRETGLSGWPPCETVRRGVPLLFGPSEVLNAIATAWNGGNRWAWSDGCQPGRDVYVFVVEDFP